MSKQSLYSMVSSRSKKVISRLFDLTQSNNENVALGACKVLLNKILPDLNAINVNKEMIHFVINERMENINEIKAQVKEK